jgi:hypothetical protein
MEPEGSLPYSQQLSTGPSPEPGQMFGIRERKQLGDGDGYNMNNFVICIFGDQGVPYNMNIGLRGI